ncbi:bifunctional DNA primase/polymerase [Streptomyces sp. CNQ085]|uniref:bifunctional DNA primase/polymerase n=1 Tax=Streptomyces sp. CNQ085 TaxID=2886944 RepID=UPI001F510D6A|nr:bifunctional DNA primase/polymerase [Streptomyces sp. CNQ085]MCI0385378.1 bifunctional DNA primase/polymerase [Streptomyces sp. CNQ085]
MNITTATTAATPVPAGPMVEYAVRCTRERLWDVFPGAWLEVERGIPRCSCGAADCGAPGAHPTRPDWAAQATSGATAVRRMWADRPRASVLLPTGRAFDAIEVPETTGCLALARMERMGVAVGPVTGTPKGRMLFFVQPGGASRMPDLVRRLGWSPGALDLTVRGDGDWVAAPPTRVGARGAVLWVRQPADTGHRLPEAEEIVRPLAYACGRDAAATRVR